MVECDNDKISLFIMTDSDHTSSHKVVTCDRLSTISCIPSSSYLHVTVEPGIGGNMYFYILIYMIL